MTPSVIQGCELGSLHSAVGPLAEPITVSVAITKDNYRTRSDSIAAAGSREALYIK